MENPERGRTKNGLIKITGEETKRGELTELIMKPRAVFTDHSGLNYFLVMKRVGLALWKPVYKSEKKAQINGYWEWNTISLLTTDVVEGGNID